MGSAGELFTDDTLYPVCMYVVLLNSFGFCFSEFSSAVLACHHVMNRTRVGLISAEYMFSARKRAKNHSNSRKINNIYGKAPRCARFFIWLLQLGDSILKNERKHRKFFVRITNAEHFCKRKRQQKTMFRSLVIWKQSWTDCQKWIFYCTNNEMYEKNW